MVEHTFVKLDTVEYCGVSWKHMKGQTGVVTEVYPEKKSVLVKFNNYDVSKVVGFTSLRPVFDLNAYMISSVGDEDGYRELQITAQKEHSRWYEWARDARNRGDVEGFRDFMRHAAHLSWKARWIMGIENQPKKVLAENISTNMYRVSLPGDVYKFHVASAWSNWKRLYYNMGYCVCYVVDDEVLVPAPEWTSIDWIKIK